MAFTDTFTEASNTNLENHTPSGGTAWTLTGTAGSAIVIETTDTVRGAASTGYYLCDDQGSANQYSQGRLKSLAAISQSYCAVRLVDSDNFIGWRCAGTGAAGLRLVKVVSAIITDLISFQGVDESIYKVEANGTTIKIFQDGVQQGTDQTVTDFSTETSQGIVIRSQTGTNPWLDDFEAGALSSTTSADLSSSGAASLTGSGQSTAASNFSEAAAASLTAAGASIATAVLDSDAAASLTVVGVEAGGSSIEAGALSSTAAASLAAPGEATATSALSSTAAIAAFTAASESIISAVFDSDAAASFIVVGADANVTAGPAITTWGRKAKVEKQRQVELEVEDAEIVFQVVKMYYQEFRSY